MKGSTKRFISGTQLRLRRQPPHQAAAQRGGLAHHLPNRDGEELCLLVSCALNTMIENI